VTKELYPVPGRIIITCRVTSIRNRRKYTSTEIGTNSMHNVARDYKDKIQNAKLNAVYKHMNRGGGSDAVVEVIDFDISYFKDKVTIHREQINKKKYVYATDKVTGKRVNKARIVRRGKINDFS
jgi:hypothetical protein